MSPPITLYTVRWLYPDPEHTRYPALKDMEVLPTTQSLTAAIALYLTWQIAYYLLVAVRWREKVESGKRMTSYTWLLNDPKGGVIAKTAHTFGEKYSIPTFMGLQLIYTVSGERNSSCFIILVLKLPAELNILFVFYYLC